MGLYKHKISTGSTEIRPRVQVFKDINELHMYELFKRALTMLTLVPLSQATFIQNHHIMTNPKYFVMI